MKRPQILPLEDVSGGEAIDTAWTAQANGGGGERHVKIAESFAHVPKVADIHEAYGCAAVR